jgi:hypothetical protein
LPKMMGRMLALFANDRRTIVRASISSVSVNDLAPNT